MNAYVYCRTTTENTEATLTAQKKACVEYCARHGFTVARTFTDKGVSGLTLGPALTELLRHCQTQAHKVQAVVVHSPDRLSRSLTELVRVTASLNMAGVVIRAVNAGGSGIPEVDFVDRILAAITERGSRRQSHAAQSSARGRTLASVME